MAENCRARKPLLATWVLGALEGPEADGLVAHLSSCADCRSEVAELTGVAAALRLANPLRAQAPPAQPPPRLGEEVSSRIAAARRADRRRRAQRVLGALAAAVVVVAIVGTVAWWFRDGEPEVPTATVAITEIVGGLDAAISVEDRGWGASVRIVASGLDDGAVHTVWVEDRWGTRHPAGTFIGLGEQEITCYMAAGARLDDAVTVGIDGPDGAPVLRGDVPTGRSARVP